MKHKINHRSSTIKNGQGVFRSSVTHDVDRLVRIGMAEHYARVDDDGVIRKIPNPQYPMFLVLAKLNLY